MFTGCDTTSAFYGKGKIKAMKVWKTKDYREMFTSLGKELELSNELKSSLSKYVCHLYGLEECSDVNFVRYELFKSGKYEEQLLPPNQDSLDQHARRANLQCYIWRHALQPILNLPTFYNHGWRLDDKGNVAVEWMTIPAAPDSVLEFVHCKCSKGCENRRCSCIKASLKCSELCKCTGCQNKSGSQDKSDYDDCYDSDTFDSCDDFSSDEYSENE